MTIDVLELSILCGFTCSGSFRFNSFLQWKTHPYGGGGVLYGSFGEPHINFRWQKIVILTEIAPMRPLSGTITKYVVPLFQLSGNSGPVTRQFHCRQT